MSTPEHLAESGDGWLRRLWRYSPFNRSHGLRRLPDDVIGAAVVCSVLFHAVMVFGLVRAMQAPRWFPGAEISLVSLADLVASVPERTRAAEAQTDRPGGHALPAHVPPPAIRTALSSSPSPLPEPRSPEVAKPLVESSLRTSTPKATIVGTPAESHEKLPAMAAPPAPAEHGPVAMVTPPIVDTPLDAGWPEPPPLPAPEPAKATPSPLVPVVAQVAAAARELTPALMVPSATRVETPPTPARPRIEPAPASAAVGAPPGPAGSPVTIQKPLKPPLATGQPVAEAADRARPASPLGMGSGPLLVRLDGPTQRVTDQPNQTISVPLQPGSNSVRVVAVDSAGLEADDLIAVQYVTPLLTNRIVLATPDDGLTLGPEDPPVVVVEGEVEDKTIDTVWVVANDRRVPVTTRDGHFRQVLVVSEPVLRLWAEASVNGSPLQRSKTVTVRSNGSATPTGILIVQWPRGIDPVDVEVSATWRSHADRLDIPAQTVSLPALAGAGKSTLSDVFYLRGVKPGVYTLTMRGRGTLPPSDVRSTFYFPGKAGFSECPLRPARLG